MANFLLLHSGFQDLALKYSKSEFIYNFTDGLDVLPLLQRTGKALISYRRNLDLSPVGEFIHLSILFVYSQETVLVKDCRWRFHLGMDLANLSKYPVLAARCICGAFLQKMAA